MVASINASTTAGVVTTADTSGILALQTAGTTAVTIDASQNTTLAGTLTTTGITNSGVATATRFNPTGSSVTGNGMYLPAANSLGLSTNGTNALYIDSSQNVGIGTSSPSYRVDAVGAGSPANGIMRTSSNLTNATTKYGYYTVGHYTNATVPFGFIQGESNSTENNVHIGGGAGEITAATRIDFYTAANNSTTSGTERMRINSSGVAMFGTTNATPAGSSDTKGISIWTDGSTSQIFATSNADTAAVFNRATSDGALIRLRRQGSDVGSISVTASATAYNTSSDYRLKENIAPMTGALAKVALLKPVTYKWKVDGSDGEGFIAHELAEVKPDCVSGEKDATREEEYEVTPAVKDEEGNITTSAVMGTRTVPVYQGIDTSFLVATLTAAIQELKAINNTQAELISGQTATINALVTRIEALENRA